MIKISSIEVNELQNGYTYIYEREGKERKPSSETVDQYIRVSFTNEGIVRRVQSTTTRKTKKFSGWRTFGLPFTILGGLALIPIVAAAASNP